MSLDLWDLWEGSGVRLGFSNFPGTIIPKYNLDSIFMGGSEYIDFKTEFCFGGKLCNGKREYLREKVVGTTSLGNARCFLLADDETTSRAQTISWVVSAVVWMFVFVSCS